MYSNHSDCWIFNSDLLNSIILTMKYSIPIHLFSNTLDPCIHQLNIQLAIRLTHSYTECIFNQSSAGSLHTLINIQLVIRWISAYTKWIFSWKSTSYAYIHCLLYWSLPKKFVMLIKYLVGNNWVISSLSYVVHLLVSSISNIGKQDHDSLLTCIEYHFPVISSLSEAVCLLDSIGYLISDVGKSYNGLLLVGHVTYIYWIPFCQPPYNTYTMYV